MCKLKEVEGEKSTEVRVFIAPATFYGVVLLNVKRLVKFIYCLNLEVENAFIHPERSRVSLKTECSSLFLLPLALGMKTNQNNQNHEILVRISSFPVLMLKLCSV